MGVVCSIDVGYGDVKAVFGDGEGNINKKVKFPTAIAPYSFGMSGSRETPDSPYRDEDKNLVKYEGNMYFVGERALEDENCKTTRRREFLVKYAPLFFYHAASRALTNGAAAVDEILTGIPLEDFVSPRFVQFKDEYGRALGKFVVNDEVYRMKEVSVYAQGHGIYVDYVVQSGRNAETALVLDIGFNTVDVLGVVKGTPSRKHSLTLQGKGVVMIVKELQAYLRTKLDMELSEQTAKNVLMEKRIKIYGSGEDLSDVIAEMSTNYSMWLLEEIEGMMEGFIKTADRLVIAGGGAYYVKGFVPKKYEKIAFIPEEPEFANTRGFYYIRLSEKRG